MFDYITGLIAETGTTDPSRRSDTFLKSGRGLNSIWTMNRIRNTRKSEIVTRRATAIETAIKIRTGTKIGIEIGAEIDRDRSGGFRVL
jgi:hypothetical protein